MKEATGSFEVKVLPLEASAVGKMGGVARMSIDKVFAGGIVGTSQGEMLTTMTEGSGAMAYVAIETVRGELDGRKGTFVLMHRATMTKGDAKSGVLEVEVVAGSGTGELVGLRGTLAIHIDGAGKHTYVFAYVLP